MSRQKMSVDQKVREEFPEFVAEVSSLETDALNGRLAQLSKALSDNEDAKDNDEELEQAKERASFLGSAYRDTAKAIKLKRRFITGMIRERGGE